jgi:hypothetical protein
MKKLILSLALSIIALSSMGQTQNQVVEKFKLSKKVQGTNIEEKVDKFMSLENRSVGEMSRTDGMNYHGKWSGYERNGINKDKYTYDYDLFITVYPDRVETVYNILSVTGERTYCDKTQRVESFDVSFDKYLEEAKSACEDLTDRLDDYINDDEYESRRVPSYYNLNYIVDSQSISYYEVIPSKDALSKNELYSIVDNYFAYAYRDGNSVIQTEDKEKGMVIGKGIYAKVHEYNNGFVGCTETYDAPHVLRVDCRDGRVRATITISTFDITRTGSNYVSSGKFTRNPVDYEPFGHEDDDEVVECIENVERCIKAQFAEIKKAIDEGITPVDNLNDW